MTAYFTGDEPHELPDTAPSLVPAQGPVRDGYIVELGGRIVCEHYSLAAALSAGLQLKGKNAGAQVRVYDARERAERLDVLGLT